MLELVTIHAPADTPVGLHHLAFFVDDLTEAADALTGRGWPEFVYAETPGGTAFALHDARHELGHFVEIYEETDGIRRLYERVRTAAQ